MQVVAPVRETCAQTLGVVMKFLDTDSIQGVLSILIQLLKQQQWEVRHGGLLGIKYLLAVRMVSLKRSVKGVKCNEIFFMQVQLGFFFL